TDFPGAELVQQAGLSRSHSWFLTLLWFPEDFVIQAKADCYFTNGTDQVRFVVRFIFNLEEYLHFDSDLGMFVALTELGEPDAEQWNKRWDLVEQSRASVNMVCRQNYKLGAPFTVGRNVPPEVTVSPERTPLLQQHKLLLCSVTGFYPGDINVRWFRNGQEQRSGVMSTGLVRNGDWTFQKTVTLEMTPELGDVYSCLVEHPSLQSPVSVEWGELYLVFFFYYYFWGLTDRDGVTSVFILITR
ncbi:HLA class II histocompatibility antigen, DO beta chain-like, partial [Alexandromys fortis]|uniref:HLA class II histocompatibility antigen, DO beta chain-like n=1 Tax=Alexandromys fortis TaxID=100897 RepID=UPI0021529FBF